MPDTERREYSRVDAFISLQARVVPGDENGALRSTASAGPAMYSFQSLPDLEENALSESIRIINSKLDAVLRLLTLHDKDVYSLQTMLVNISGSGISFDSEDEHEIGQLIELKMIFPETPDVMLCVYGEVVKCENRECNNFKTCIRFTIIDEEIRNKIIKYVFDKQREMIRKARRL
jgi:c-di-GMP-binding flagellar brake protein YcgR